MGWRWIAGSCFAQPPTKFLFSLSSDTECYNSLKVNTFHVFIILFILMQDRYHFGQNKSNTNLWCAKFSGAWTYSILSVTFPNSSLSFFLTWTQCQQCMSSAAPLCISLPKKRCNDLLNVNWVHVCVCVCRVIGGNFKIWRLKHAGYL